MRAAGAALLLLMTNSAAAWAEDKPAQADLARAIDKVLGPCPATTSADIVVCGERRAKEQLRYRLPIRQDGFDPAGPVESVSRERHRLYQAGESGTGSCSVSGAGGWTGCLIKGWRARREQYGEQHR
jgi:hypothetical protein